eukprot:6199572-Pleurochrysis_carterae.AAC.2
MLVYRNTRPARLSTHTPACRSAYRVGVLRAGRLHADSHAPTLETGVSPPSSMQKEEIAS